MEFTSKEQLLNFIITHLEIKYCHVILAMVTRWAQIQNCLLSKGTCCLSSKPLIFPPVYGMLEKKLAKSVSSKSQRQHMKEKSVLKISAAPNCYSMDHTLGKLLTLTKSTRQHHHRSRGGNPCTAFSGSLGAMIQWWSKLDWHPAGEGNHGTHSSQKTRELHTPS